MSNFVKDLPTVELAVRHMINFTLAMKHELGGKAGLRT